MDYIGKFENSLSVTMRAKLGIGYDIELVLEKGNVEDFLYYYRDNLVNPLADQHQGSPCNDRLDIHRGVYNVGAGRVGSGAEKSRPSYIHRVLPAFNDMMLQLWPAGLS